MSCPRRLIAVLPALLACLACTAQGPIVTESGTVMVPMRDGVTLATDVWLPAVGTGPWPVMLARTPYNKDGMKRQPGDRAPLVFVIQDCRGRGASQGRNIAFEPDGLGERRDGYDTCEWVLRQPWCNGKIGTFGGSAVGITQVLAAAAEAPGIACQMIDVAAGNLHEVCYDGGAWCQALVEDWLKGAQWDPANLAEWRAHPLWDDYWRQVDAVAVAERTTAPGLFTGGWYDIFSRQTIQIFRARQERGGQGARGHQKLVMGPWGHGRGRTVGELTFPENAANLPPALRDNQFARYWLFGQETGIRDLPAVHYYLMGAIDEPGAAGNEWRTAASWPPPEARLTDWHASGDGVLAPAAGAARDYRYTYDPSHPVPTVGGRNLTIPAGPMDQRTTEGRPDVIGFETALMTEPLAIAGDLAVACRFSSSARDTDLTAKLCDVYPDGRSMLLVDGALRLRSREGTDREVLMTPGTVYEVTVDLGPVAVVIAPGHRLRLSMSSSNAPRFQPNPNTGGPFWDGAAPVIAENTLHGPLTLRLPILAD